MSSVGVSAHKPRSQHLLAGSLLACSIPRADAEVMSCSNIVASARGTACSFCMGWGCTGAGT